MNQFGDSLGVIMIRNDGFHPDLRNKTVHLAATFATPANILIPESIDWRTKGAVTPIKDQGDCGSDWAFSTTGALEGQHFRKTGRLISLSKQNLIDCSLNYGNEGCGGGDVNLAFQYIKENHDTEETYPNQNYAIYSPYYETKFYDCRYKQTDQEVEDIGFVNLPNGNEEKLKEAVATVGPISVAIDASLDSFKFYSKGIYNDEACSNQERKLNHAVLVVGYGTEGGQDYWLVKNSWGTTWGEEGYIRMSRNKNNQCGVASFPSYPLV